MIDGISFKKESVYKETWIAWLPMRKRYRHGLDGWTQMLIPKTPGSSSEESHRIIPSHQSSSLYQKGKKVVKDFNYKKLILITIN